MKMLQGDCLDVLKRMDAQSFDGCLCDPPYGLSDPRPANSATPRKSSREAIRKGFMGMKWDGVVPGVETWAAVLRVLKPGAFMLAFGGTRTYHRLACAIEDAGFEIRDCIMWLYGSGFPKHGSCLKPAWEPIIVARKSGSGLLNIDACRIGTTECLNGGAYCGGAKAKRDASSYFTGTKAGTYAQPIGRWPANVILDEEAAAALDEQSGTLTSGNNPAKRHAPKTRDIYGLGFGEQCLVHRGTDSGGASRFFYCAKASRKERGDGNTHPTVKPLKLTEYLARLILPLGNDKARLIVPFAGSGSEMIGAKRAGWKQITGIEREPAYAKIAAARLHRQSGPWSSTATARARSI